MALTANHASSPRNVMRGFKPDTSFHVYLFGDGMGPMDDQRQRSGWAADGPTGRIATPFDLSVVGNSQVLPARLVRIQHLPCLPLWETQLRSEEEVITQLDHTCPQHADSLLQLYLENKLILKRFQSQKCMIAVTRIMVD